MKLKLLLLIVISIFCLNIHSKAQLDEVCGIMAPQDTTNWGIGLIKTESNKFLIGINKETNTFWTVSDQLKKRDSDTKVNISSSDLIFAGHYGNSFLKVFSIRDTKYNVLVNSIEGGIWIDFDNFNSLGLTFNTYYSMLFDDYPKFNEPWRKNLGDLGINLNKSCLNIRNRPSADSEISMCLKKNTNDSKFYSISIQHHNNEWAAIQVFEYISVPDDGNYGEGCAFKIDVVYHGWVKAIDDNGYPNLWYGLTKY